MNIKIKRFKFDFIVYLVLGILLVAFGIVIFPFVTELGRDILKIVTAIFLIIYLITFLLPKLMHKRNSLILAFHIIEFVVVALIALGNILSQFKIINVSGVSQTIGLTLFMRGLSELVISYCATDKKKKFVFFMLDVAILTLGVYLFAKPLISDETALIILGILFILVGGLGIYLSIRFWDKKPKSKTKKVENK